MWTGSCMSIDTSSSRYVEPLLFTIKSFANMDQLAGQRKKEVPDDGVGSTFVGLRTPYWG